MLSLGEALARVMDGVAPLDTESVALTEAHGRVLATDLLARCDSPPFANSAMDGYAVRAADLASLADPSDETPCWLPVQGESSAGGADIPPCAPGSTVRIFTGAPLPAGADTVVMQEVVERDGARAAFRSAVTLGQNVRQRGEDVAAGHALLGRGATLRAGELGLLASQGIGRVDVTRRPRVGIISGGDELRRLDDPDRPGSIVNSNAYMLEALVREAGCVPDVRPIAPDHLPTLTACLRDALDANDLVISTGGVSVGDHDLMRDAFVGAGVGMDFWKVAVKPGKPFAFGRRADGRAVVGLPGNPVSAFATFQALVHPLLRALGGDPTPFRRHVRARLSCAVRQSRGRDELLRARLVDDPESASGLGCIPVARRGSGALPALAGVDVLALVPMGEAELPVGTLVECLPLFDVPGSATSAFGSRR